MKQNTIVTLTDMKARGEKISQLTCYDYSTARLMDQAGINMILVGDSLGMTMQGYSDTIPVTMEEMIVYGRSVVRGCENTFVVVDMPFMSYQASVEQAVVNAGRLLAMGPFTPKFVKHFAQVGQIMTDAFQAYDAEVKDASFPAAAQTYAKSDCSDEILERLEGRQSAELLKLYSL